MDEKLVALIVKEVLQQLEAKKQEEKPVERPKINHGYQIETFLNDE